VPVEDTLAIEMNIKQEQDDDVKDEPSDADTPADDLDFNIDDEYCKYNHLFCKTLLYFKIVRGRNSTLCINCRSLFSLTTSFEIRRFSSK
jgi:hypothetical protein